ncbi:MAG TPA: hypothetical protein DCX03_00910 [Bacteroidales bacterium]|nr:hypothetical protein [Bacteroidales bacterium]
MRPKNVDIKKELETWKLMPSPEGIVKAQYSLLTDAGADFCRLKNLTAKTHQSLLEKQQIS